MQGTYPFRPVEGRHIEWSPGWTRRKRDERGDPDEKREQATSKEVPNMLSLTKDICLERVELVKRGVGRRMGWTRWVGWW